MRKWHSTLLLAAGMLVLGASTAMAQYGQFEGTVRDATGGVLPGATVTATNQETGVTRIAVSAGDGRYRLPGVLPGVYDIRCELAGFSTHTLTDIILTIQQTAIFNFELTVAQIQETVTVTGESPIVDTKRSDISTAVSELQIQDLPVASRRWVDLALLTPGVSQDAIRGFYYRGNVNMGAGGRYYANAFIVDGVNNTWAEMGEARQNFPMDAIGEFKVTTSNFKAEYGLATGGLMTVVSKSGTNEFQGSAFLFFRDKSLTSKGYFENEKPDFRRYQYGGAIGGPIVRDKTHFFFSYERTDEDQFFTINTNGAFPDLEGTFPKPEWRYMWLAKLNHQISASQSLWARVAWEDEYRPNLTAGGSTVDGFDFAVPRNSTVIGHTWLRSAATMNEFRFQRAFSKYEVSEAFSHGSWDPGDFNAERLALCPTEIRRPSVALGSCNDQMGPETRWQFKDDFTYFNQAFGGDHQFKMCVDYNYIEFAADSVSQFARRFTFASDLDYDPNNPDTHPISYNQRQPSFADKPVHHFSTYFQDDWSVSGGLTLNLGLRYDVQVGSFNEDIQDIEFPVYIPYHEGADRRGDFNNFGPRIGIAWDPTETGRTVIKGGYGIFYENIRTLLNWGERNWHQRQDIIIPFPDYEDPLGGKSREEYVSTAPPNIAVLDNAYENPYAHHYNVGVSHSPSADVAISVDFTHVRTLADRASRNINYPNPDGALPNPDFNRVDQAESTLEHKYTALLAKFEKRFSNSWQFLTSYTLSKSESTEPWLADVSTYGYTFGTLPGDTDRRHRLVLSGIVQLPWDVSLSTIMDLRSALPVNVNSGTDLNRDSYGSDLPPGLSDSNSTACRNLDYGAANAYRASAGLPAVSEGAFECSTFVNVDLRASKTFPIGDQRIEFVFQVLNLFDRANFDTASGNLRSGNFGTVTSLAPNINAPSRQVELALRFQF